MRVSDIQPGKKSSRVGGYTAAQVHAPKKIAGPESLITLLLSDALRHDASDIHIIGSSIRYRVAGSIQNAQPFPVKQLAACVAMIKQQALFDEIQSVTQTGHFQAKSGQKTIDVQATTMPTIEGEKVVLHIAPHREEPQQLQTLGFWGDNASRAKSASAQPRGLVIISGLAGPQTSRTAISLLYPLSKQGSTVATLEDPVEEYVPTILQTQINHRSGLTFESGLRSLLHQDVDAIMLSDLRDRATAQLAVQAAVNRQLIFAILYSPNAASAITNLLNMGVEPYLLAASLNAIIAQRQIRQLCDKCKLAYKPSQQEIGTIFHTFGITTRDRLDHLYHLENEAGKAGVGSSIGNTGHVKGSLLARLYKADPKGCNTCRHTGYGEPILISEVLQNSDTLRSLITHHSSADTLQTQAIQEGMIPMHLDGLVRAMRGIVSIEEIIKNIKI